jgi:plastocyanin
MPRLPAAIAVLLVLTLLGVVPAPVQGQALCPEATPVASPEAFPEASPVVSPEAFPEASPVASPTCMIKIDDFDFDPLYVSIQAGTTVMWVNFDRRVHGVQIIGTEAKSDRLDRFDTFLSRLIRTGRRRRLSRGSCG